MELFTQHALFSVLKGGAKEAGGLDIKAMFANIPAFLAELQRAKDAGRTYLVDEPYLQSIRALVQETADTRKQWLGYFLINTTLDVHSTAILSHGEM